MDFPYSPKKTSQRKPILALTLAAGIGLHAFALYYLQDLPLHFSLSQRGSWINSTSKELTDHHPAQKETLRRNEELAYIFNQWIEPPLEESQTAFDLKNLSADYVKTEWQSLEKDVASTVAKDTSIASMEMSGEVLTLSEPLFTTTSLSKDPISFSPSPTKDAFADAAPLIQSLLQATDAPLGLIASEPSKNVDAPSLPIGAYQTTLTADAHLHTMSLTMPTQKQSELLGNEDLEKAKLEGWQRLANNDHSLIPISSFAPQEELTGHSSFSEPKGGSQDDIGSNATIASTKAFSLEVDYAPRPDGQGYLFRATLVSKPGIIFKRIAQNYFFLIDRSHSIDPTRYEKSKAAVLKALSYLKMGDTFNILIFDDHIVRLSPQNLAWNREHFLKAYDFLKQQKHGGIFATTDLYSSLGDIVPDAVADNEINTTILLSDGDTFLSRENQRQTIGRWTKKNQGKVSLFCMAAGPGNNLPLLDLLSSFNKGYLCYTSNLEMMENTLENLMTTIQNPIGKDMVATAIVSNGSQVNLFPRPSRMPDLYEQKPYVIFGTIDNLKDFTLFFQGKYYDKWLDIKQVVAFGKANAISLTELEKSWITYQAYDLYDHFLNDGKNSHIVQAKQLLTPLKISPAFQ